MSIPYTLKDAGGAGNCFYYSIYEALKNKNLLDCIKRRIFNFNIDNKEEFNINFRHYLSENINIKLHSIVNNICDYKTTIIKEKITNRALKQFNIIDANDITFPAWQYYFYLDNKNIDFNASNFNNKNVQYNPNDSITITNLQDMHTKKQAVDAEINRQLTNLTNEEKEQLSKNPLAGWMSNEFQHILETLTLDNCENINFKNSIVEKLKVAIRTDGVYVSEIEVREIIEILKNTCNITVNIINSNRIDNYVFDPNTIWVQNINEGHYKWFEELGAVVAPVVVPVEAVPVKAVPVVPVVPVKAVPVAKAAVTKAVPVAKAASIVIKISTDKSSDTQSDKSIELTDCVDIDSSLLNKEFQNPSNIIAFILKEFNKKYEDEKDEKDKKDEKDETNIKLNFKKILLEVNNIEFENKQYTKELICDINLPIINITDLNFIQDINLVEKIVTYRKLEIKKQIIIINYTIEVYKNILIKIKCYEYNDVKKLVNIHKIDDLKTSKETCIDILNKFILQNSNYLQTTLFRYVDLEESLEKIRSNLKLK